ncbi:hypothetical protein BWQ96_05555 [Gracilariopsis chorda]|uniref:UBC core domain-containing protein n=1 Tax=Gracilariopsis chorda TaxID=448386 RepID=A0A2V3IRF4_9FLOR|nr:hypothetical protein BWQ96_05555 [Gracilariopsis chorda]|eukprot:PXF44698.1 hypothetical protein BWQ96_05555 [Gracilariopsis chorda]
MDQQALEALRSWKACDDIISVSPCASKPPVVAYDGKGAVFTARASFEFPDGGRFYLLLSGSNATSPNDDAEPLTAMIEDDLGLPDGFLIDINTFLFSDFSESARHLTPAQVVHQVLFNAGRVYDNIVGIAATARKYKPKPRPPSQAVHASIPDQLTSDNNANVAKRKRPPPIPIKDPVFAPSRLATTTLMKQISILQAMDTRRDGFTAQPTADDLYQWTVMLYFDNISGCDLVDDIKNIPECQGVELELRFPSGYPNAPPFIRVVSPYIFGGHVGPHGGICMELLTTSGWAPVYSLDLVCIQIRALLIQGRARAFRSHQSHVKSYTYEGALNDHRRIVRTHRWNVPDSNPNKTKKQRS